MFVVVRQTIRSLASRQVFTLFSVVLLAFGVGAVNAILGIVSATFFRPLPYRTPDALYYVQTKSPVTHDSLAATPLAAMQLVRWRAGAHALTLEGYTPATLAMTGAGEPLPVPGALVSAGLFGLLGVGPILGHGFGLDDERPHSGTVLISYGLWQRRFGRRPDIIGTSITVDGEPRAVIGVMPKDFTLAFLPGDAWLPLSLGADDIATTRLRTIGAIARVKPHTSSDQATEDLERLNAALIQEFPDAFRGSHANVVPLRDSLFGAQRGALIVMSIAVLLLLLIAAANVVTLSLADVVNRRIATLTRLAFGASRRRIIRARLVDSVVTGVIGTVLGLGLGKLILAALTGANANAFVGTPQTDVFVTALTLAIGVVVGVLAALPAAFLEASFNIASIASAMSRSVGSVPERRARELLLASQMAITLILLIGATVLVRRARELSSHSPGFDTTGVVSVQLTVSNATYATPEARGVYLSRLLDAVRAVPGVTSASSIQTRFVLNETMQTRISVEDKPNDPEVQEFVNIRNVMPDLLPTLQIGLLEGRGIDATDRSDSRPVAVVSTSLAQRYWGRASPIGKRIQRVNRPGAPWLDIVGMVDDIEDQGVGVAPGPTLYVPYLQQNTATTRVTLLARVRTAPGPMIRPLREAIWSTDRSQVIEEIVPLHELLMRSAAAPRFQALVVTLFGAAAFALVLCGVYALTLFGVLRRTRELGVRAALGALPRELLRFSMWQGLRPMLAGLLIGTVAAVLLILWAPVALTDGLGAHDAPLLGAVWVAVLGSGAVAAYLPALRATRVSPMTAMRS